MKSSIGLLTRACDLDEPKGCQILAEGFKRGILTLGRVTAGGWGPNYAEAGKFYTRWLVVLESACGKSDAEHVERCRRLAAMFQEGALAPKDDAKASELYAKVLGPTVNLCDQKIADACYGAGLQYKNGLGTGVNVASARRVFALGCNLQHGPACFEAGRFDDACALGLTDGCDKACERGNKTACDKASPTMKRVISRRVAGAVIPALLKQCSENRALREKIKLKGVRPGKRAPNWQWEAEAKLADRQHGSAATLTQLDDAIENSTTHGSPEWEQLLIQRRNACYCKANPERPGHCEKYKPDEPLEHVQRF